MKITITILLFMIITFFTYAQKTPEYYLTAIPPLPANACALTENERTEYLQQISKLHNEITAEIRRRKKEAEANSENQEKTIKNNLANQYGISESDMQKMQKGKMTETEKKELMQKMMKAGMNNQNNQKKNMENFELAKEQKTLTDKIMSQDSAFQNRMKELDEADTNATREYKALVDPLYTELWSINDGEGATDQDGIHRKDVLKKISDAGGIYCSAMSPLFFNILTQRGNTLKTSLPDYKRLEEVISQLNKNTTGINEDIPAPGLMELDAIENYIYLLKSAFRYCKN